MVMPMPGVHIETLLKPQLYSTAQLDRACAIAESLARGKLVLCEPPERKIADGRDG